MFCCGGNIQSVVGISGRPTSKKHDSQVIPSTIKEGIFPSDFAFGVGTSAYQVEGAYDSDDKGLSIWDAWSHTPGKIAKDENGDIANDMYHLYPEDIKIMKEMNIHHYRFSIAWSRILPLGKFFFVVLFFIHNPLLFLSFRC
jgi:hypothetical protein